MSNAHELYRRWIEELSGGKPGAASELVAESFVGHWPDRLVQGSEQLEGIIAETRAMFTEISFAVEVGPIVEGDMVAGRWTGQGSMPDGETMSFFGNDILRIEGDRFVEYWTASSAGS